MPERNFDIETGSLETIVAALRDGRLSAAAIADRSIANHAARGEARHRRTDRGQVPGRRSLTDKQRGQWSMRFPSR